eukprot:4551249-Pyramimonas_sp.AAC.1
MEERCPRRYSIGHVRDIQRLPLRLKERMSRATLAKSGVADLFHIPRAYRHIWSLRVEMLAFQRAVLGCVMPQIAIYCVCFRHTIAQPCLSPRIFLRG